MEIATLDKRERIHEHLKAIGNRNRIVATHINETKHKRET